VIVPWSFNGGPTNSFKGAYLDITREHGYSDKIEVVVDWS